MDLNAVIGGFVPIASAAIGAAATYAWQAIANRRIDRAVRVHSEARILLMLPEVLSYYIRGTPDNMDSARLLRDIAGSLDDISVTLAFRSHPQLVTDICHMRVALDQIVRRSIDRDAAVQGTRNDDERQNDEKATRELAANVLFVAFRILNKSKLIHAARRIIAEPSMTGDEFLASLQSGARTIPAQSFVPYVGPGFFAMLNADDALNER